MCAALLIGTIPSACAWWSDPSANTPICTAANSQVSPQLISDGAGGAIITWDDRRNDDGHIRGNIDVYAQRVDSSGRALWTANGVAICTLIDNQSGPQLISDGAGGAIITWQDSRNGWNTSDIYAQRVNSGAAQWAPNGVAICTAAGSQLFPWLIRRAGGAIISWSDSRSGSSDIYAQRVDLSGRALWTANGVAICTAADVQRDPRLISDGAGGATITWWDFRSSTGTSDIYAQRVDSAGRALWTAEGVAICTAASEQIGPELISDGAGGAVITWYDLRSGGGNWDIYAQRVNSAGAAQWTADGIAICTAADEQGSPRLLSDGAEGAIITWTDGRSGSGALDIYAQRVDLSGRALWTADGVPICTAADYQEGPRLISDGAGGAVITWSDWRSGNADINIYAQRVDSAGRGLWTANGVPICSGAGQQAGAHHISDGAGGSIIAWSDRRSGYYDIYAQRVNSAGSLLIGSSSAKDWNLLY